MKLKYYKKEIFLLIIVLIVIGGVVSKIMSEPKVEYVTDVVGFGDLKRTVFVTGSVISDITTDLHFEINGKLDKINYEKGDSVIKGDVIAELVANDELIQVQEAQAALDSAVANLDLKKAGSALEDIKVTESNVNSAEVALKIVQTNLDNVKESGNEEITRRELELQDAEVSLASTEIELLNSFRSLENIKSENKQAVDSAYESLRVVMQKNLLKVYEYLLHMDDILGVDKEDINDEFQSSLGILKSTTLESAQQSYREARGDYRLAKEKFDQINSETTITDLIAIADDIEWTMYSIDNALLKTRVLLNNSVVSTKLTLTKLDGFKNTIDEDRIGNNAELSLLQSSTQALISAQISEKTNVDNAQAIYDTNRNNNEKAKKAKEIAEHNLNATITEVNNNIKNAELEIEAKIKALDTAKASLDFKTAPPRQVDIASLEAQVSQATASLALANKNLEKTKLRAPADGILIDIKGEVGENISISQDFAVLISSHLIIEADISEADIDKIALDQVASITFDSFGEEDIFTGNIFFIDPTETRIQDVIYYKIKVSLDDRKGKSIRSGMTANLDILTASKSNVLYVSQRSVVEKGDSKIVRVLSGSDIIEKNVSTGIRGDNGVIEILSGLKQGERVIISVKK